MTVTTNGQTTNVLTVTLIDQGPSPSPPPDASVLPEFMKKALIAGPAQITIAPVSGATLFVTYIRHAEPTPTPIPTITPTS